MSVNKITTLLGVSIAIILNGCASQHLVLDKNDGLSKETVNKAIVEAKGHTVSSCQDTQRDLTIPWSLRQYWCADENKEQLQIINDGVINSQGKSHNINDGVINGQGKSHSINDKDYIAAINNEVHKTYSLPIVDAVVIKKDLKTPKEAIQKLKENSLTPKVKFVADNKVSAKTISNKKTTKIITNQTAESKVNTSIIFAHKINVLGPKGRKQTHSLIEQVSQSKNVRIRGIILHDEILVDSDLYREKVSVARALAVRQYWQDNGVDITHVKILHHNPLAEGRKVEVQFNG